MKRAKQTAIITTQGGRMYWLIIISVIMFGLGFLSQEVYGKMRGSSIKISLQFGLFGSIAGLVVLLIANAFKIEFTLFCTWFTL